MNGLNWWKELSNSEKIIIVQLYNGFSLKQINIDESRLLLLPEEEINKLYNTTIMLKRIINLTDNFK